jgi:hypothetical protein
VSEGVIGRLDADPGAAFSSATARERESGVAALPTLGVSDRRDFFGTHGVATRFFIFFLPLFGAWFASLELDAFGAKRTDAASGDAGGAATELILEQGQGF